MKDISELDDLSTPAWARLLDDIDSSFTPITVLPRDEEPCRTAFLQIQVPAESALGAVVSNTGGLIAHHGWLRIFGGCDTAGLPSIVEINEFPTGSEPEWTTRDGLVLAHDVFGGTYALNGVTPARNNRPGAPGEVVYFAARTLSWEALGMDHDAWLGWVLSGGLDGCYEGMRWPGWRSEVSGLDMRDGLSVFPFLWAMRNMAATGRRAVPIAELLCTHRILCEQLGLPEPGFTGTYPLRRHDRM